MDGSGSDVTLANIRKPLHVGLCSARAHERLKLAGLLPELGLGIVPGEHSYLSHVFSHVHHVPALHSCTHCADLYSDVQSTYIAAIHNTSD